MSQHQTTTMESIAADDTAPAVYIPVDSGEVISILHSELPEEVEDMIEILAAETAALHVWVQVAKAYVAQVRQALLCTSASMCSSMPSCPWVFGAFTALCCRSDPILLWLGPAVKHVDSASEGPCNQSACGSDCLHSLCLHTSPLSLPCCLCRVNSSKA